MQISDGVKRFVLKHVPEPQRECFVKPLEFKMKMEYLAGEQGEGILTAPPAAHEWQPRSGFVGTKTICNDRRFQKDGKNPPRTTIDVWITAARNHDTPPETDYDPATNELYLPESWVFDQIYRWSPRRRKPVT